MSKRRRVNPWRVVGIGALALLAFGVVFVLFGLWQFQRMERVAVSSALSPASPAGTNYLIVGSDSREGFDPNDPTAAAVLGDGTADDPSERSDTILILRVTGDGARMLSIPRDLWVQHPDGSSGRINAAYRDGPAALISTIRHGIGIPVHHYVEVDFVTFAGLVNSVGGVTIHLDHPARDDRSGLNQPEAGAVTFDGSQALAYVRSRHYAELIDGSWRTDPTGDLGRVQRQQHFLRSVMGEVGSTRNPIELMRISSALAGGLRVDDRMGLVDALRFALRLRGLEPESIELPVYGFRTGSGAAVLGLVQPEADAVLVEFGR
jgi:LCP family protein required for cell wall assembly